MKDKIQAMRLVYFSPSGTTKTIIQGIARGINLNTQQLIDITRPDVRKQLLQLSDNELLIVGVPVYMGRVPAVATEWLHTIKAINTPTVCVVVYGNRAYDNALLELKDILVRCGCKPIAGATYIGEHSFSSDEIPISEGRPDARDLRHAELFGIKINELLHSISSSTDIDVPGDYPYRGITQLWSVDFIKVGDKCTQCGICSDTCPVEAIDRANSKLIDIEKCITCCTCIKTCPQNAKTMKSGMVRNAAMRLNELYQRRNEPEYFLPMF